MSKGQTKKTREAAGNRRKLTRAEKKQIAAVIRQAKHNIISSEDFSDSVSRYDKWTNRYHTECCFICSFWIFSAVAV